MVVVASRISGHICLPTSQLIYSCVIGESRIIPIFISTFMKQEFSMSFQIPEQMYTALFDAMPGNCVLVKNDPPTFTILAATPAYLQQTGYTKEAMIGKGVFEAFPVNSDPSYTGGEALRNSYLHASRYKQAHHLPVQRYDLRNADGSFAEKYWKISNAPVLSPEGEVAYIIHTSQDITAQVHAEKTEVAHLQLQHAFEQLEESEGKYRTLFESMDQGFCVLEMIFDEKGRAVDYRFLEVNPVFSNQTGLLDPIGKTARELVPALEQHWFDLYGRVASTGESTRFTEGSAAMGRWFDVYAFRIGGNKVALLFTDVTERKQHEEALIEKDKNLRNIIHSAPVAMLILRGEDMVVDTINERMSEMIGKTYSLVNKPLLESIPELKGQQGYERLLSVYRTGKPAYGNEVSVPLIRDGVMEDRYFNFAYTAIIENGKIAGVMDVATEVTEQVLMRRRIEEVVAQRTKELAEANESLQHINKELQRSNQNLEEFAHAASHDLKEPIRKILFFTNQLKGQLTDRLKDAEVWSFSRIENATQRMGNLIDDLLLYSHVSQRPHETEPVNLNEKVKRVLEDLELDIQEKKAIINVGPLPVVFGYRRQLQQLFQNLVSNALKYSKADEPPQIEITADAANENGRAFHVIQVADNGIGFEPEYTEKIFQMFTRLHSKNEYSGTGVGLSIVKKVIENHDGFIRVKSAPDKGSIFTVYLPAQS